LVRVRVEMFVFVLFRDCMVFEDLPAELRAPRNALGASARQRARYSGRVTGRAQRQSKTEDTEGIKELYIRSVESLTTAS
jgi:hypothetical protein